MQELSSYTSLLEAELNELCFPESPSNLYDPIQYFIGLGGKRIRPVMTLMGAELFACQKENAVDVALAVELFHNFTLIHDDIMDQAPLRRSRETVHTRWNTNIAILSGDVLFVHAYQLLARRSHSNLGELIKVFNRTAIGVCEGQQLDMDFESRIDVTVEDYIEMIRLKTSVLLGGALELGAIVANAEPEQRKHLYDFGEQIGIAFQIKDDILDLYSDAEAFGKQVGGDVIANKKTLLKLYAYNMADRVQLEVLNQLEDETDLNFKVQKTREIYTILGVREACENEMKEHYRNALNSLNAIDVPGENKYPLISLADYLMSREI